MKVIIKIWIMVVWTMSMHADWTLGTVVNKSDLVIEQAWRYGLSGKPQNLSALSTLFSSSHLHQRASVVVKYHIGSRGVALRGKDGHGHEVDIFLDGQPTHSIEWKRTKTRSITKFPQKCMITNGLFCARVLVQDVADGKYIADPVAIAHDVSMTFNLILSGNKGAYRVSLQEA